MAEPVLVMGATGGFGAAMVRELVRRGRRVRAQGRTIARLEGTLGGIEGIELAPGDALQDDPVMAAAEGCGVIVHAVNLPYSRWVPDMEYITSTVLRAARANRALVLFPGNVYGFGHQTRKALAEDARMSPDTRKGAFRIHLEHLIQSATTDGDVRAIVLRAGDFFGPTVRNGLVDRILGRATAGKPIEALGRLDVPHQWAYVPDLARLAADLIDLADRLAPFEVVHFAGHVVERQRAFLELVAREAGHPDLPLRTVPWWLLRLMGLYDPQLRELMELRYLFDDAVIIDDPRRRELLPDFAPTPLGTAVRETLESYRHQAA